MMAPAYTYRPFDGGAAEWNDLIGDADGLSLLQTWEYGEAKAATGPWRAERGVVVDGREVVGAAQTMVRVTPFRRIGMAWINRGPLVLGGGADPAAMLRALHGHFVGRRGLYLRIAPALGAAAAADVPGLRDTATPGWASAVVDLTVPEQALRQQLNGKWRNALVRAEAAGLAVRAGRGPDIFSEFLAGHERHLERLGADGGLDSSFLRALRDRLPADGKPMCLVAREGEKPLGGVAIAGYGGTGEYLAGHNTGLGRASNAGQLLLWSAMIELKADGFKRFDLGGMDERLTPPGIYRFKKRVGGVPYRLASELEGGTGRLVNKLIRWRVERERKAEPAGGSP